MPDLDATLARLTERLEQAEAARRDSERRFDDIAQATSDWIWECGPDMRLTFLSHRMQAEFGTDPRGLLGKTLRELARDPSRDADWAPYEDAVRRREPLRNFVFEMRPMGGRRRFLRVNAVPVFRFDGGLGGYRGAAADVTPMVRVRQRLERAHAVLDSTLRSMDQGIAVFGANHRLVICNRRFGQLLDLPAELLRPNRTTLAEQVRFRAQRGDYGAVDPETVVRERLADLADKVTYRRERQLPNGIWLQVNGNPLGGGGLVMTLTDISAIKAAEARSRTALAEAAATRRQLTEAIEAIADGFVLYDAEDRLVLFNSRYRDDYSFGPELLRPGTRFIDILREGVARGLVPPGYDAEQWVQERLDRHRSPGPPYVVRRPDGRWVRITEHRTQEGGIVGIRTDVSELKSSELALKENQRLLRAVIDAVPAIINVKDLDSRYVLMNRFQGLVYGVAPEAAIGRTSAELVGEAYGSQSRDFDRQVIESGRPLPYTERDYTDIAGRPHTWFTAKMPLKNDDGSVKNVVTVALDITTLKNTERARANLARYFPPNMVEVLANADDPFGPARQEQIAVLFADIVGFTRICEEQPPAAAFALLRDFQSRMSRQIFAFSGTLDKYTGDGMMATFGTPRPGPRDATNALRCARAMQRMVGEWNDERRARGEDAVGVCLGLHYGPALLGNIGDENRLEFAVIGDTVNIASRLEKLARPLAASIVVSQALIDAAMREDQDAAACLAGFESLGPQPIRGRDEPVPVWVLRRENGD